MQWKVLIHTLTMNFIGNPKEELESKKIILTNLRCPTLGDFKWYKYVFINPLGSPPTTRKHNLNEGGFPR